MSLPAKYLFFLLFELGGKKITDMLLAGIGIRTDPLLFLNVAGFLAGLASGQLSQSELAGNSEYMSMYTSNIFHDLYIL